MRRRWLILLGCIAVLLGGYAGYRGYRAWQQRNVLRMARGFLAKGDARDALLCLGDVLRRNPRNLEAARMTADLMEINRSPSALLWRSRVVELDPKSVEDRLALARAAMMSGDLTAATNALASIPPEGRQTVGYHNVAGNVDAARGLQREAEAHFREAARLDPTNPAPRLNLAGLLLRGTNTQALAEARASLTTLSADPRLGPEALRELVLDALRFQHPDDALRLSADLLRATNAFYGDRLLRLAVLKAAKSPEFKTTLGDFQREAGTNSVKISQLASWQARNGGVSDALTWLKTLPPGVQTNQTLALLGADLRVGAGEFAGLRSWLQPQNWGEIEFLRHAFLARALRGQDQAAASKAEWRDAVTLATPRKERLAMLVRSAGQWRWLSEREELLWTMVESYPDQRWAFTLLTEVLYEGGRTESLLTLFRRQLEADPADLSYKNNVAILAMLLNKEWLKPHELARDLRPAASTNALLASTYAYSLLLQGKSKEALKVFEQFGPKDLETPAIAGYYGLVLKATGNAAKAKPYFEAAFKGPLLPEEKSLFDKARGEQPGAPPRPA